MSFGTRFLGLLWGLFLFLRFCKIKLRERERGREVTDNMKVANINTASSLSFFFFSFFSGFNEVLIEC